MPIEAINFPAAREGALNHQLQPVQTRNFGRGLNYSNLVELPLRNLRLIVTAGLVLGGVVGAILVEREISSLLSENSVTITPTTEIIKPTATVRLSPTAQAIVISPVIPTRAETKPSTVRIPVPAEIPTPARIPVPADIPTPAPRSTESTTRIVVPSDIPTPARIPVPADIPTPARR